MKYVKITENLTMVDEDHLGGFIIENDPGTFTPNLWQYICHKYKIKSVLDLGCGMGFSIEEFLKHCSCVVGIDGSEYVQKYSNYKDIIIKIDFSKEKYDPNAPIYDLTWSSEFLEHVHERYILNYIDAFKKSKYAAITHADIGQGGHHHVNCKPKEYWVDTFSRNGFEFLPNETEELRKIAYTDAIKYNPSHKNNYFYQGGLFFKNIKLSN
jgi:SAM-dependent methyltransferase